MVAMLCVVSRGYHPEGVGSFSASLPAHYCTGTVFLSTLCPITAPATPPMAAPIRPPVTLSRFVVAPMIAPAVARIAASRPVFLTVLVRCGAGAE